MITFKCITNDCSNKDVEYNFFGDSETVECGGCKSIIVGINLRPDPEYINRVNLEPEL